MSFASRCPATISHSRARCSACSARSRQWAISAQSFSRSLIAASGDSEAHTRRAGRFCDPCPHAWHDGAAPCACSCQPSMSDAGLGRRSALCAHSSWPPVGARRSHSLNANTSSRRTTESSRRWQIVARSSDTACAMAAVIRATSLLRSRREGSPPTKVSSFAQANTISSAARRAVSWGVGIMVCTEHTGSRFACSPSRSMSESAARRTRCRLDDHSAHRLSQARCCQYSWSACTRLVRSSVPPVPADQELCHLLLISMAGPAGIPVLASPLRSVLEAAILLSPWVDDTSPHLIHQVPFHTGVAEPCGEHGVIRYERSVTDEDTRPGSDHDLAKEAHGLLEVLAHGPRIVEELVSLFNILQAVLDTI